MVGRSDSGYLVEEVQDIFQRSLHMALPPGRPWSSWHNGRSPQEQSQKRRKRISMKVSGVSLGIDVPHRYCQIPALAAHFVNVHWPLQKGADSWGAQKTVLFSRYTAVIASGEFWKECSGGEVSVIMIIFYTGTFGIILHISSVISQRGTWNFKNSCQNQQSKVFKLNRQTPSSRALTAQPTTWKLYPIGRTHM